MFRTEQSEITGCLQLIPNKFSDLRGSFVKVFHKDYFKDLGLETEFVEDYYTESIHGVIRGMHFQSPPFDHNKLIYCVNGEVFDAILDLRVGSPTYGKASTFTVSAKLGNCLYVPKGLAHGFCVLSEKATLVYKVSSVHSISHDSGIHWNSANIEWPSLKPIISQRDMGFQDLASFSSPFKYE